MEAPKLSKTWHLPALILLLALGLRLGMGIFLGFNSGPDRDACGADAVEFEHMAWSFAEGTGFIAVPGGNATAFRAPGYPLLLGVLYALFGRHYLLNRILLSTVGTATCGLVYLLVVRIGLSRKAALLATLISATLPLQFYYTGHFTSEPVAAFLNVAATLMLLAALQADSQGAKTQGQNGQTDSRRAEDDRGQRPLSSPRSTYALLVAAGLICGLSVLVRPASLTVPIFLACLLLASRSMNLRKALLYALIFGLAVGAAVLPWSIRNAIVFKRFCLVASNGGSTFWGANNQVVAEVGENWGSWISTNFDIETKRDEVLSLENEIDRDRKEWKLGRDFLSENPKKVPLLVVGKIYRLVTPFPKSANRTYVFVVAAGQFVIMPLFFAGLVILLRNREMRDVLIPINAQLLAFVATTLVFYGCARFRAPYEPFIAIYAAVAATETIEYLWRRLSSASANTGRGVKA